MTSAAERTWVVEHCVPQPVDHVHLLLYPLHLPVATLLWLRIRYTSLREGEGKGQGPVTHARPGEARPRTK